MNLSAKNYFFISLYLYKNNIILQKKVNGIKKLKFFPLPFIIAGKILY